MTNRQLLRVVTNQKNEKFVVKYEEKNSLENFNNNRIKRGDKWVVSPDLENPNYLHAMNVKNPQISLKIPLGFKIANIIHIKEDKFVASDLEGHHCIIDVGNHLLCGESLSIQEILLVLAI